MIVDLFAGPGGWDEGLRSLGLVDVVGVEIDPFAVATRRAAGHATVVGDCSLLEPAEVAAGRDVVGLIASPPCQLYSTAGSKRGRRAIEMFAAAVGPMLDGDDLRAATIDAVTDLLDDTPPDEAPLALAFDNVESAERAAARTEARYAALVLEPARWLVALRPRWVVLEQVPAVLPLWETYAEALRERGWHAEAGMVNAADYGVPQTRKRAVLVASLDRPVALPTPTHSPEGGAGLERWITMAEALGWDDGAVASTVLNTGRDWKAGGSRDDAQTIELTQPAPTVAGVGGQWQWRARRNDQTDAVARGEVDPDWPAKRPATTIAGRGLVTDPGSNANRFNGAVKSRNDGVKVTVVECGILQSFPPDYPWQGPQGEQQQQIGNAVPPLLAAHVVRAVVDVP